MNKKAFTNQEFVVLMVMADLLEKGEVETRIAKYMHGKRWDATRASKFLDKCMLSAPWRKRIWDAFLAYPTLPFGCDPAQFLGQSLRQTVIHAPKTAA